MKKIQLASTIAALVLGVSAEKIVLQNSGGSNVCQDTYIEETINSSFSDKKYMGLELGDCPSCHEKRILIKYDFSSIPSGKEIQSATLTLYCNTDNASTGSTAKVYYPKADWKEDEADWFESSTGNKWNKEGGDIGLKALATFEIPNNAANSFIEFDLTETVADYISGEKENRGFIILLDDIDNLYIESSEAEDESLRPKLTIDLEGTAVVQNTAPTGAVFNTSVTEKEIRISGLSGNDASLSLFSLTGKKLYSKSVSASHAALSTEGIAKGAYLLQVISEASVTSQLVRVR